MGRDADTWAEEHRRSLGVAELVENQVDVGGPDEFYAALYLGLSAEAAGDILEAKRWLACATASPYAQTSKDYIANLAFMHERLRGWA